MLDHTCVAVIAFYLMAAGAADRNGRVTAAVQKQKRLLARVEPRSDSVPQRRRNPVAWREFLPAHVHGAHLRQVHLAEAVAELKLPVLAGFGIHPAFQAGGGRCQDHLRRADRGAQHRHVTCVIGHSILLLVGSVVLLIDDDQAEIAEGQEKSRTRTDYKLRSMLSHHAPGTAAFGHGETGMPFRRHPPEPPLDAFEKLRRQRDFRQ